MKAMKFLIVCAALVSLQASAQQPTAGAAAGDDAANRAQALEGGRISPRQRAELEKAALAERNEQAGKSFLAANKARPGVTTLASGVQYKVITAGNGKRPGATSTVLCRYKGTLTDGSAFDKSDDTTPSQLNVAGLVPGLREAIQRMPAGSKWEVVVPPQLGYGARGREGVGSNAVLIYVVDLIAVS